MREEINALLKRAKERLEAAWELYLKGYYNFAISNAYYSMYYCARALLLAKGISPKSHAGVHSLLGREFVKTKEMPMALYTIYSKALNMRHVADYDVFIEYSKEDALDILNGANEFLKFAKKYLGGIENAD
ncbi:HEPN domain-containing protein [Thermococci archaeon]|nr:MAG: HEPN domain-containing protein [Thermococci archaeon]